MSGTLELLPAVEPHAVDTYKVELAGCYRNTSAVWREDAREWRVMAESMPEALKFIALRHAEWAEQQAMADDSRAEALL